MELSSRALRSRWSRRELFRVLPYRSSKSFSAETDEASAENIAPRDCRIPTCSHFEVCERNPCVVAEARNCARLRCNWLRRSLRRRLAPSFSSSEQSFSVLSLSRVAKYRLHTSWIVLARSWSEPHPGGNLERCRVAKRTRDNFKECGRAPLLISKASRFCNKLSIVALELFVLFWFLTFEVRDICEAFECFLSFCAMGILTQVFVDFGKWVFKGGGS